LDRSRFARLVLYVVAAIGILVAVVAVLLALRWQPALELWTWAAALVETRWRRVLFGATGQIMFITVALMVLELFFLSWEKTTVFRVFVRRNASALADLGFAIVTLSSLKWVLDYVLTFGVAFGAVKLGDAFATRMGWLRWELPSEGVLEVAGAFAVYYLVSTFVGYWQHRLMHWRGFWHLHRFHHSATDFNILTGFRANPAEMISNVVIALSPLALLKIPDAGLFTAFVFVNLALGQLQHSELPWNFGWFGRWVVASPQMHQVHHSIDEEHRDRNFSNCPLWDQLFGTWYGGPNRPSAYGIVDPAHVERPATQWLIDIWIFYRDAARALAGVPRSAWAYIGRPRPPLSRAVDAPVSIPSE
jgi:sterol desaturase/sphingolipid hydroxylase (fatty acid hydroxylase superfamily)